MREERGERRLAAFVVPREEEAPGLALRLREHLRSRLPAYMVPPEWTLLDALPLNANGKVDRKALASLRPSRAAEEAHGEAPRTPVEEVLAGIWGELLGREQVGADGHFFELGGHSLLAAQVASRLHAAFGVELPLRTLFEAPVLADLATRIEEALRVGAGPLALPLVPVPREGPLPLSFAQQRLWFLDQLEPGSPLYNIPAALRMEGPLDPAVLALCLGEIVRRHEALRTVFSAPQGTPVQVIRPAEPFILPLVDLSGLPEREGEALALAQAEAGRPFDLGDSDGGPLLRGLLLRLAEDGHFFALTLHHIASDGWSMGILVREVAALYAAFAARRPSPLPELPVQYADFAVWQRSWLHGELLDREIFFWRRQLAGLPPLLDLPTDRPRPAVQSYRGRTLPLQLPAGLVRQAEALGRREGATLFMVLLAGFQALLARCSGQDDLAVGSPSAGRHRVETEGLIGFFVNTLVLRGDLSGAPSFRELLGRVRETALAAWLHQDVPFEKLVEELAPGRDLSHPPLFQVMLALQNAPAANPEIETLRLQAVDVEGTAAKFDLTVSLAESGGGLAGTVEYAIDLFDAAAVQRLAAAFERLLDEAVAGPDRCAADLPLLSAAELHQLRFEQAVPADGSPGLSVLARFESWADRTPDAVAVQAPGEAVTWAGLDRRANQVARRLVRHGVSAETRVGVCAERSLEMLVAVLGILKAGGAYVPLDPAYPQERLAFMIEDSRVPVLLTQKRLLGRLPAGRAATLLLDAGGFDSESEERLPGRTSPESLAYVIYTSGSTGLPKGVMVHHRGWSNLAVAQIRLFGVHPGSRVLQFASLSFDASASEIAMAICSGATLVLGPPERRLSAEELTALLRECTIATLPPTTLAILAPGLEELETLVVAGEACPLELARSWVAGRRFLNAYGPTETTVCATAKLYDGGGRLSIGRPIDRTEVWVLDARDHPVPLGVTGELCVGGAGLARGYLDRADLTAARFVPHPFTTVPGERLYRTGDLAFLRPGGEIELLGRLDHQVKIRGFRIEPGEIEAVLTTLPGVREAVVVARGQRLIAYLSGDAPEAELHRLLRERLPDHLVPAVLVKLAALPLTPNGKVDRRALPAPEGQAAGEVHLAPRTPVEEVLAGIWGELLGRKQVGADGHFFELGGHSLLAAQVASRLHAAFGVELPLRTLFEAPVLADLATRIEEALRVGAGPLAPPLVPVPREGPLPLSFAQQRLWFIDQLEPGSPLYNIPAALRMEGPLDPAVLALCLGEIVRRHEALRTVFSAPQGTPVQVIRPAEPFILPLVDLSGLPEREGEALALAQAEAGRPFDLGDPDGGPLLRGLLLRLAEDGHFFALTLHHIASDGWSMGILVREVAALYAAFAARRPSPLPELPVQYADFAVWQRSWLHGELLDREIFFWRRQLAGLPPLLDLPTDRPRPAVQSYRGRTLPLQLPAGLVRQAEALGRREGATLFMVLLAGFQALLARCSGQDDLAVGSPAAGRHRVETEGLIGFFVNTLVLRGDLSGAPSFRELLGRVRETALAAWLHQDVPFEKLVEELAPGRDLSHPPLFQVMLALQNAPAPNPEIETLRLQPVDVEGTVAKFDLTVSLAESGGGLAGTVEYAIDLFDAAAVQRLAAAFERLLDKAVAGPDRCAADLPLLSAAELHQLRFEQAVPADGSPGLSVLARFESWADRTPDAVAVQAPGEAVTWAGLDRRANQVARRLVRHGVSAETRVGVCAERSLEMLVAVLGILKAGGAYVPLDPAYPQERLAFMIEDSRVPVLLTQKRLLGRLPAGRAATLLLDAGGFDSESEERLPGRTSPESLAYVIYTSGSTGLPKGVMVHHRGWSNLAVAQIRLFGVHPGSRVLQFASLSFDASASEIAMAICSGATLVLGPPERRLSAEELTALLRECTIATLPPTTLAILAPGLEELETLVVAGEACPLELARSWVAGRRFLNAYGPTETTVCATAKLYDGGGRLSIGRPIDRTEVWVLDARDHPVPLGVTGELCVGGAGLARGYLDRADLTAARFVPHPFTTVPGERLYRTGDLAFLRPGGEIELLGRLDHQVKIRGFRIEPGEIEAVLTTLPGVREAVVVARGQRLIAYLSGDAPEAELHRLLRERLPDHLVPAVLVKLAALPLTPNGKVDRRALPAPEGQVAGEVHLAPRTPVEEVLAGIWGELLGLERVGADGHFFELGGHSLLAAQVASRLHAAFGVELPLRTLFEAPVLADLATRIEEALRAGAGPLAPPLVPVPREGPLPLSFAQQRLWFLDRLSPGSAAYNIPLALVLEGELEVRALASALSRIVDRHESLRTTFDEAEGAPVQVIHPPGAPVLPVIDLEGLGPAAREAEGRRLTREEMLCPFDLARGPLFRTTLVRLGRTEHLFLVVFHHIVSDGWSLGVLVHELEALWSGSPLPELAVQYGDFAVWQRSWLQGEVLEAEIAFWRERLAGAPALLDLPADRPRPAVQSERGAAALVELPASLAERLEALGRAEGATLFMVLLATFQTLLARWSGREDVSVGTPVAGRGRLEVEGLIGFFVNTLVQRTDLSGDPSWRELLARVREGVLDAHAHQDVPFEKLVEELVSERSLGHAPLFQVMLNLQTAPAGSPELPGLRTRVLDPGETPAKFDLSLALARTGEGLTGLLEYTADLFDRTTVQRLLGQLARLLEEVAADPGRRLSDLPLLDASERHQLLVEWNDTGAGLGEACLHELFERQAARTPDAVALIAGTERLRYRELDARAERLARRLRALGVGPESRVAVHLRRSPEMVVALLAVLKAGGAYVPIDPAYPRPRVDAILEDARPVAVLTEDSLRVEDLVAPELPARGVAQDHLAYVIFTSGSTGRPKGVAITHRSAAVLLAWAREVFPPEDLQRVLFATSICFDLSVFELFLPLSCGGAVVLAENALALPDLPAADEVTLVNTVPSALAELVASRGLPPSVRTVNLAGEPLRGALVRRIQEIPTVRRVLNLYGPSEDTTYSTFAALERAALESEENSREPAIGRPVAGTQVWLLDRHGQPVPSGASGELMLSGAGLARGYLGRPDLTAERFLPNPLTERPGDRLYRTGDLARYRADGALEYLGRLDHQVKIRGFRIELGEIEAALASLPGVREAVVQAHEEVTGGKRLVAWVGARSADATSLSAGDLRGALSQRLPEYMVPSAIVVLEALPRTPNGKVDRKALPDPSGASDPERALLPPRDPLELELVRIWEDVLQRRLGIADSFFDLGGHSLLAVRLLAQVEQRFGHRLSLAGFFSAPTVERQAEELRGPREGKAFRALVPLATRGEEPPFFCVHAVGGGVFAYLELARRLGRPFYGLQAPPADCQVTVEKITVESLAALYLEEVRQRQPRGPYFLGGWSMGAAVAFEMAQALRGAGEEVALLALLEPSFVRSPEELSGLSPESLFEGFVHDLALQGQPELAEQAGEPLGRALFETFRANLQALETWHPSPYEGPAHLFLTGSAEDTRGWEEIVRGGLSLSFLPGDHYSFLRDPHLPHLVERLRAILCL